MNGEDEYPNINVVYCGDRYEDIIKSCKGDLRQVSKKLLKLRLDEMEQELRNEP